MHKASSSACGICTGLERGRCRGVDALAGWFARSYPLPAAHFWHQTSAGLVRIFQNILFSSLSLSLGMSVAKYCFFRKHQGNTSIILVLPFLKHLITSSCTVGQVLLDQLKILTSQALIVFSHVFPYFSQPSECHHLSLKLRPQFQSI